MASIILFLVFSSFFAPSTQQSQRYITKGSSLTPITNSFWLSPSGLYAFGFYRQGNGYSVGIFLSGIPQKTVVWTANRNNPPFPGNVTLLFTDDGKLIVRSADSRETLIVQPFASRASLSDLGNFVLYDSASEVVWQSFENPTDTLLPTQRLEAGKELVSSVSENDHSAGIFRLSMQNDGNLVQYPVGTLDTAEYAYWESGTFNAGDNVTLNFDQDGRLYLLNSTGFNLRNVTDGGLPTKRTVLYLMRIDPDGIFRVYSYNLSQNASEWSIVQPSSDDKCSPKGICGFNSYCTFNDNQPYCLCLPGSDFINPNQKSLGCSRNYSEAGCKGGKENGYRYGISQMQNMEWGDLPYIELQLSVEECSNSCLEDCNCGAALFDGTVCKKHDLPLRYVKRIQSGDRQQDNSATAFLKVGNASIDSKNKTTMVPLSPIVIVVRSRKALVEVFLLTSGLLIFSFIALVVTGLFIHKFRVLRYKRLLQNGNYGFTEELTLQLFSYNELKRATNGFKEELGKGSFGAVYKGTLYRGKKVVAVKRLEKLVEEGEKEFRSEMRSIGRTHHRNLVQLLGFCAVDSKRLLVYEYMSNGSLADLLFKSPRRPDWNERVRIALDVARGILYLHEECESTIIHCDIKPQNILMDEFWTAKISDFGLAKLLMPDQTRTFTGVRGTRGYLAPEWQTNAPISVKADVYSYGILLLEIVCCRKNMETTASKAEEIILSTWAYKCFAARELYKLVIGEQVDKSNLEKMVKVGLWCIQDEPALRPSMKSVVMMLEGISDVLIPPCPVDASRYSSSILLHFP